MNSFNTSSHLVLCLPHLLLPSALPNITSFSIPLALIVCPKKVSACLAIMPSNEISGFISSKTDLFVLLAVHGILSIVRQHHSLNASIFLLSLFLIVQLSQPYIITGKTNAFTKRTFVCIDISLSFMTL